jgi:hypothetical protein
LAIKTTGHTKRVKFAVFVMPVSLTNRLNLSKLKWVKVVHDPAGWAYARDRLKSMPNTVDYNDATVFPLGFHDDRAKLPEVLDKMALIQKGSLTHIVEIIDEKPYEDGDWYNRMCRIVWWQPETKDWNELEQEKFLGFSPSLMDGRPHIIENLSNFGKRWNQNGKMEGFLSHLRENLS